MVHIRQTVTRQCDGSLQGPNPCASVLTLEINHVRATTQGEGGWLVPGIVEAWDAAATALGWTVSERRGDTQAAFGVGIVPHPRADVRCPHCAKE